MYLMPFLATICPWKLQRTAKLFFLGLFGVTVALLIGLRHEIGNDWFAYFISNNHLLNTNLYDALFSYYEPGYNFINWVSAQINFGIYGANLFCSAIFVFGLIFFSKTLPYPWISLGISMPVIGIVFAMGATRQSAALGFTYIAIKYLMQGSRAKYFIFICLAMTFHKSAIVMMPFGMIGGRNNKLRYQFMFALLFLFVIWLFWDRFESYYIYYMKSNLTNYGELLYSYGGRTRVWMNVVPVLFYFLLSKNKNLFKEPGGSFWKNLSLATIISIPLVEFFSLATDRVNLYFSVIQIMIWPRIISIQRSKFQKAFVAFSIFLLYSMVLFVWLNFARNRHGYFPYQNIMFPGM